MARQTEVVLLFLLITAATAYGKCPNGWVEFEGRCFFYQGSSIGWASAEKRCLNLGAHLVSIHSYREYQLVKSLIRAHDPKENPTWIGLSGCQEKFNWLWSDGSRLTFTEWNPNEPNFNFQECCVHMNFGSAKDWNDIPCHYSYPFVCARRI